MASSAMVTMLLVSLLACLSVSHDAFVSADDDLIDQLCKTSAEKDPNIHYPFCVAALDAALKGQPRPTTAQALALLTLEASLANATATKGVISDMIAKGGLKDASLFKTCLELYDDAEGLCNDAVQALKDLRIDDAQAKMSAAMNSPGSCDDQFSEEKQENPLKKYDDDFFQLTAVALSALRTH